MERPVDQRTSRRVIIIGRLALLWALCIVGRLAWLQVWRHDDYLKQAKAQQKHTYWVLPMRGEILDREGKPLAVSIRTETAVVNPSRVENPEFFARWVAPVVGLNPRELETRIREHKARSAGKDEGRNYLEIKRHLTPDEKDRLKFVAQTQPIEIVPDARREYTQDAVGAHVIGSLTFEGDGRAGVEQKLNEELKGEKGRILALTDSRQRRYYTWIVAPDKQGVNLTLTIHRVVQQELEQALAEGVNAAKAASGTAIALDPQNGEVLGFANYPTFDPRHAKPAPGEIEAMHSNIGVQLPCEPGSVMKIITATAGLGSQTFTLNDSIYCENGAWSRPKRPPIHDHGRHGTLPYEGVVIVSSNIGAAKIADRVGPRVLYDYLKKFGIGERTGIELPAESRGMLRPQDCAGRKSGQCWDPASHEYIAFGHEVSATAVQLARAVAVFANGGLLVQPHLVKSKERPKVNGGVETIPIALAQPARVIPPELAFTIRKILQKVVKEGTGKQAAIPGYSSGGKTGTAEIFEHGHWSKSLHNSSFIGFAPVTNPRVVVVVTMNRTPKQGASASAPVFRHIALTALQVMNVPKDEPETDVRPSPPTRQEEMAPAADTLRASERPLAPEPPARPESSGPDLEGPRMPDFSGKSVLAVMHEAARLGIEVAIVGNGLAKVQHPPAGTILPRDGKVSVEFAVLR